MGQKWGPLALLNSLHKFLFIVVLLPADQCTISKNLHVKIPSRVIIFSHVYEKAKGLTYVTEFPQKSIESSDLRTHY